MDLTWLRANTIFLTVHGSQAYGLNHALSDLDVKGVCIPPSRVRDHLFQGFEQAENAPEIHLWDVTQSRINPANPKVESNVFSLKKFFKLAADVNPNIIEVLFTDESDHLWEMPVPFGYLRSIRNEFLSSKAKFTFTGYAIAQLNKINRHRKWLINPVAEKPTRESFGLPPERPHAVETIAREVRKRVEEWNFHQYSLDELERAELKEKVWELVCLVSDGKTVDWDNWPDEYWKAAIAKLQKEVNLSDELTAVITREHEYQKAVNAHTSYLRWQNGRNPERKALEERFQYDVKHAKNQILIYVSMLGIVLLYNANHAETKKILAINGGN